MRAYEFLTEKTINGLKVMSLDQFVAQANSQGQRYRSMVYQPDTDKTLDEAEFGVGARFRPASPEEMQAYLHRVKTKKDRTKAKQLGKQDQLDKYNMPYVHPSNIKIVDAAGHLYNLADLKKAIMQRPSSLLKKNEKMQHSDGTATQYFNVGLPALKGLAVNEETGEFVIVDTCPGAGACKVFCYARKGSYVMFDAVSLKQTQTLNFLLNDPEGFASQLKREIAAAIKKYNKKGISVCIRWHDSGDFFSPEYAALAFDIARSFPNNDFYAYTKMANIAKSEKPANFKINFSSGALPSQERQVNLTQIKHSIVVPKEMFRGKLAKDKKGEWQWISAKAYNEFKQALADKYRINPKSILTYDEFLAKPRGTDPIWNVIVKPGEGDTSANSADVLGTFLLFH